MNTHTTLFTNETSKPMAKKNLMQLTSHVEPETTMSLIQDQLNTLIEKLTDNVSPEFKALMESYVNKANEIEELKVNLENMRSHNEEVKLEILKVRETNRNLIHELQNAREALKNLEHELSSLSVNFNKGDEEYKNKIQVLTSKLQESERKTQDLEEDNREVKREMEKSVSNFMQENEKLKQEHHDQNFKFRQNELELITERDNFKKHLNEIEMLLKEQNEQFELKTKEIEYKDALINQLIKRGAVDKLSMNSPDLPPESPNYQKRQKKNWPF